MYPIFARKIFIAAPCVTVNIVLPEYATAISLKTGVTQYND